MNNIIYGASIDLETTGLLPRVHEICEICIILFNEDFNRINIFKSYIKPETPWTIQQGALDRNKLTKEFLNKQPKKIEVRNILINWLSENIKKPIDPMGHYYHFDQDFLELFLGIDIYNLYFSREVRDTKVLAKGLKDKELLQKDFKISLENLCEYYGIKTKNHTAEGDAMAALKLWSKILQ
jgi:DNA polymerase III epsilon subunit-like protein